MSLTDNKIIGIIFIKEFEDGEIQWDSTYTDVDEALEVMYVVSEEMTEPQITVLPIH